MRSPILRCQQRGARGYSKRSAGIRIVQTPPDDLVYAALAEEPSLSIDVLSGPEELLFGTIASARRDAAGNLIVADRQRGMAGRRASPFNVPDLQSLGSLEDVVDAMFAGEENRRVLFV